MKTKTGLIPQKAVISFFGCFIAAAVMVCCFLTSCNNKEDLLNPASNNAATLTSKSLQCGKVFTVSPSGNYKDDSYNIQAALDNSVAAGHGSTVQLTKGTFYLSNRIEVEGFDGFFKGVGKEKTIITTTGQVSFDDIQGGDMPALIKFRHGNIHISDLTVKISDPGQVIPSAINITGNSTVDAVSTGQAVNSTFDNVKFVGGTGNYTGDGIGYFNVFAFIYIWSEGWPPSPLNGGYKITNCEFQTAFQCISSEFTNGPCIIGGDESSGNKFVDSYFPCLILDVNNSRADISYNHFTKIYWTGVYIYQGQNVDPASLSLSKFLVYGNDIEVRPYDPANPGFTNAVFLADQGIWNGIGKKMDANVSNNKIYMNNISWGGIVGSYTQDVRISNNKIWGNAMAGIYCGIWGDPSTDWLIKGNDVEGVNAQVAPIWLGSATSNCVVYADKKDVLDEGTNNILIGDHEKRSGHHSPLENNEEMMRHHNMMKWNHRPDMK